MASKSPPSMSVFLHIKAKFYVDLPHYEMNNLVMGAKLDIAGRLLKYDPSLEGIILAYKDVKPLQRTAFCYADSPYLHIPMEATFLVFRPVIGCHLPGTVTYISQSAVSLTIFDYFEANLDIADLRTNWSFENNQWYQNRVSFVEGDVLVVRVTQVLPTPDRVTFEVQIVGKSASPSKPNDEQEIPDE